MMLGVRKAVRIGEAAKRAQRIGANRLRGDPQTIKHGSAAHKADDGTVDSWRKPQMLGQNKVKARSKEAGTGDDDKMGNGSRGLYRLLCSWP